MVREIDREVLLRFGRVIKSVLGVLCPSMEPRMSSRTGTFFWKGSLTLIDGTVMAGRESPKSKTTTACIYYPVISNASADVATLCETPFASASEAVRALESRVNQGEIYESATKR